MSKILLNGFLDKQNDVKANQYEKMKIFSFFFISLKCHFFPCHNEFARKNLTFADEIPR